MNFELQEITDRLVGDLKRLRFGPPVSYVYNPLSYAGAPHRRYLERFGRGHGRVVLLGMNPGPWGMVQTGVPFGEAAAVRDWLNIEEPVGGPPIEHPKRPVLGFDCPRSEVSGRRLWAWARSHFETPARFFRRFFVANYCPLAFIEQSGRNRTPDKLPAAEREPLFNACDQALRRMVALMKPCHVIGVGRFAERRARQALEGLNLPVGFMPHPSPASPAANRDWPSQATAALAACGIDLPARSRM